MLLVASLLLGGVAVLATPEASACPSVIGSGEACTVYDDASGIVSDVLCFVLGC
ncbi:MAG: hypothetical protein QOE90_1818 [Thermoplasmata archaeon]|jgi:hypothetical protein|nr:hypothetical protein [Thermoplasmata archaeon]